MEFSDDELLRMEKRFTILMEEIFEQFFIKNKYYTSLQLRAYLSKNKILRKIFLNIVKLSIKDVVKFAKKNNRKLELFAAEEDEQDLLEYLMIFIIFFMEDVYTDIKQYSLVNNITLTESYNKFGKNRLGIFAGDSVNSLYNETTIKTSRKFGSQGFRFVAVIDSRTSHICRTLNGKIIRIFNVGYYTPPLHPHCRSHLEPYFGEITDNMEFKGLTTPRDIRVVSWYKSKFKLRIKEFDIDNLITTFI